MSTRKSSLQANRTFDIQQYTHQNNQNQRSRKNSIGVNIFQQYQLNLKQISSNIVLDQKLTAKLLTIKKLQKMEKDAIKLFYGNQIQECFGMLQKCLGVLMENGYAEHLLYVRYLQSQFSYKLKQITQSRQFYNHAMKIIPKLNKSQRQKTKQYVASLQALNTCLLLEQGKYPECLKLIQQIQMSILDGRIKLNEKAIRSIQICRIQSLLHMNQNENVVRQCQKWITKYSKSNVSLKQKYRVLSARALAYKKIGKQKQAQQILQELIQLIKKQRQDFINKTSIKYNEALEKDFDEQKLKQIVCLLSKSYNNYLEIVEQDKIKAIYIGKKWQQECPQSIHSASKLSHLYFQIGDYEQALQQFSYVCDDNKRTSQDWQCLAEIKQYLGQHDTAEIYLRKALQTVKLDKSQLRLQIKLLHYCHDKIRKTQMKCVQKKIKDNKNKQWFQQIWQQYTQYLQQLGEDARLQKITTKINKKVDNNNLQNSMRSNINNQLMETGKFGNIVDKKEVQSKILKQIRNIKQNIPLRYKANNKKLQ